MLELNKITKDYVVANTSTTVLKGISLTLEIVNLFQYLAQVDVVKQLC